ncbi:2-phosphosulfolactate phosphatase [Gordoniibacillus kamchatkensis]|uniref:Probable 2-phosphosulfolactate phosphatase n=1 Tax=Gordoniibacillus kamchatkensis TaxID=1590651 RepID=A0ABR5AK29_9BACL|nr:2-phosphosulfolactate phosphatase [Paenibacillus sp. VKM B-2647]KIL41118.1 2-phosphosulfolactate phosphatase [Paenibacillus sp. VKM B-2647]
MQVDVIGTVAEATTDDLQHRTVIVIDALRATSTLTTALAHGASGVVPVETVQQAKQEQRPGDLLGGERFCKKIPGFDLGNSPIEYELNAVRGRRIIMTTTNGTRAIQKSQRASRVLAGSFLNGRACAAAAFGLQRDVTILCAGTQDVFSWEDGLCAGMIAEELLTFTEAGLNDLGLALLAGYRHEQGDIASALLATASGKRLARLGFKDDVLFCSQRNAFDLAPVLQDGVLVPLALAAR